jgi:hypothetical protein
LTSDFIDLTAPRTIVSSARGDIGLSTSNFSSSNVGNSYNFSVPYNSTAPQTLTGGFIEKKASEQPAAGKSISSSSATNR